MLHSLPGWSFGIHSKKNPNFAVCVPQTLVTFWVTAYCHLVGKEDRVEAARGPLVRSGWPELRLCVDGTCWLGLLKIPWYG